MRFIATQDCDIIGSGTKITFWNTDNKDFVQTEKMVIQENGNVGIGISDPIEKLQVNGNVLINGLAGTGVRNTYATSSGVLTTAPQSRSLVVPPMSLQRANANTSGAFIPQGVYGDCYITNGSTDAIIGTFQVPVGAVITGFTFYFTDNNATANLRLILVKHSTTTSLASVLSTLFQNTTNTNAFDISSISSGGLNEIVDEGEFFYFRISAVNTDNTALVPWASYMSVKGIKVTYNY